MAILMIAFCSPLYFLTRRKYVGFALNTILYLVAVFLLLSVVFAIGAPIFWGIGVAHASWYFGFEMMRKQAAINAKAIAKELGTAKREEVTR
jgi:predicted PurR-regulated permease PerM